MGKVVRAPCLDVEKFSKGGWKLVEHKSFKNTDANLLVNTFPTGAPKSRIRCVQKIMSR